MFQKLKCKYNYWKKNRPLIWFKRWDKACYDLWAKFSIKPVARITLEWFERNHKRLLVLADKKKF